jgi:hypothetical protein
MAYSNKPAPGKTKSKRKPAAPKAKPAPKKVPEMAPSPKAPAPKKKPVRRKKAEPKIDYRKGQVKYASAKAKTYKRQPTLLG